MTPNVSAVAAPARGSSGGGPDAATVAFLCHTSDLCALCCVLCVPALCVLVPLNAAAATAAGGGGGGENDAFAAATARALPPGAPALWVHLACSALATCATLALALAWTARAGARGSVGAGDAPVDAAAAAAAAGGGPRPRRPARAVDCTILVSGVPRAVDEAALVGWAEAAGLGRPSSVILLRDRSRLYSARRAWEAAAARAARTAAEARAQQQQPQPQPPRGAHWCAVRCLGSAAAPFAGGHVGRALITFSAPAAARAALAAAAGHSAWRGCACLGCRGGGGLADLGRGGGGSGSGSGGGGGGVNGALGLRRWDVRPAPAPADIAWGAMCAPRRSSTARRAAVTGLLLAVLLLLSSPLALLASLQAAQVDLAAHVLLPATTALGALFDWAAALGAGSAVLLLAYFPSLSPLAANALLLALIAAAARWSPSLSGADAAVHVARHSYAYLCLSTVWLPALVSSSVLGVLDALLSRDAVVGGAGGGARHLAGAFLAGAGSIFVKQLIQVALLGAASDLLSLRRAAGAAWARTRRVGDHEGDAVGAAAARDDWPAAHASALAVATSVLVFAPALPAVVPAGALYFAVTHAVTRHVASRGGGGSSGGSSSSSSAGAAVAAYSVRLLLCASLQSQLALVAFAAARGSPPQLAAAVLTGVAAAAAAGRVGALQAPGAPPPPARVARLGAAVARALDRAAAAVGAGAGGGGGCGGGQQSAAEAAEEAAAEEAGAGPYARGYELRFV